MPPKSKNYWLFQSNPKVFKLKEALADDSLRTFAVKAHKSKIKKGDKIILWLSGKNAGCYALGEVTSSPSPLPVSEEEQPYFIQPPEANSRIKLRIDYNLWNRPITKEILPDHPDFQPFYAGIPGTNFQAKKEQYEALKEVVEKFDVANEPTEVYEKRPTIKYHLNSVLHGPPGTGKTFQTVNHALSIIESRSLKELAVEPRADLRNRYDTYQQEGRIRFLTFHQSYSYEDFIEGIKPFTEKGQIQYGIQNGIFKQMCSDARRCLMEAILKFMPQYEINIEFNQLYSSFLNYLKSDQFTHFFAPNKREFLLQKVLRFGNLSVRPGKSFSVYTISKNNLKKLYETYPDPSLIKSPQEAVRNLKSPTNPNAILAVFNELNNFENKIIEEEIKNIRETQQEIKSIDIKLISQEVLDNCRKYVLIIDEINRGNLPGIFGELISLIEEDKREGRPEAITTILPYSRELFAVPPNLYIIATMNTSDKHVATLDFALRRRFTFIEVPPRPELLSPAIEAGVNLEKLLTVLNQRIEFLSGKDFCIGHAWLMDVQTLDDLIEVFSGRILPYLQALFPDDIENQRKVIGSRFFVQKKFLEGSQAPVDSVSYSGASVGRNLFNLKLRSSWKEADFIQIYDPDYH